MPSIPADRKRVLDLYFLEHRAKLLDLAAFLDRYDRAGGEGDFRIDAFREAVKILTEPAPGRARRGARRSRRWRRRLSGLCRRSRSVCWNAGCMSR